MKKSTFEQMLLRSLSQLRQCIDLRRVALLKRKLYLSSHLAGLEEIRDVARIMVALNAHVSHSRNRRDDRLAMKARLSVDLVGNRISGKRLDSFKPHRFGSFVYSPFGNKKKGETSNRFFSRTRNTLSRFSLEEN